LIEAGIDEVARGCLFGRVYAAVVIWNPYLLDNLDNDILKGLISHEAVLGSNLGPRSPGSVLHLMYKQAIQSGNLFTNTKIETGNLINSLENLLKEKKVEILLETKVKNLEIINKSI
jgi:phytoene dehydrogenase-like protein